MTTMHLTPEQLELRRKMRALEGEDKATYERELARIQRKRAQECGEDPAAEFDRHMARIFAELDYLWTLIDEGAEAADKLLLERDCED